MKTEVELWYMTMKELRAYAKEIGCCLGYDAMRKETTINAILSHQKPIERERGEKRPIR